ncbi:unnamed protein product [Cuscuta campestris]|uniref:Uncharacterized protein n=1 Tax=Cuscuta campestris TaxID=132261 RepID=A0A484KUQ6_9ASTE|nr:unnamed protein product [Cuscuta campestris]
MASPKSSSTILVVDPAAEAFEEMYCLNPLLRPDVLVSGFGRVTVLDAVPLRATIVVASSSKAPPFKAKKLKVVSKKTRNSLLVTVLEMGREEETHHGPPSRDTSGSVAAVPDQEVVPTRNQRKRKILLAEEEKAAHEQDVLLADAPPANHPAVQKDGKLVPLTNEDGEDVQAEANAASLSAMLRDEGKILSSLQETMDGFHKEMQKTVQGFHKEVMSKLSLINACRSGAEFSSGVNFMASVETDLSHLRKLVNAEHEQVAELEMQAMAKSEEVIRLQGLLKESKESAVQLTNSMAELEDKLRQPEGRRAEMDIELAEAILLQRSAEAERDRAVADFLQSPAFKEACLGQFAEYYDSWIQTEAGLKKLGDEGPKLLEAGVYHGIQLILRRTRRVDPFFPPPPELIFRICMIPI